MISHQLCAVKACRWSQFCQFPRIISRQRYTNINFTTVKVHNYQELQVLKVVKAVKRHEGRQLNVVVASVTQVQEYSERPEVR